MVSILVPIPSVNGTLTMCERHGVVLDLLHLHGIVLGQERYFVGEF